jgi:hypothetical protein
MSNSDVSRRDENFRMLPIKLIETICFRASDGFKFKFCFSLCRCLVKNNAKELYATGRLPKKLSLFLVIGSCKRNLEAATVSKTDGTEHVYRCLSNI